MIGREKELRRLTDAWIDPLTRLICIVGRGGEGKSALVRHWLTDISTRSWLGAEKVFGWSFYSQGAGERAASAEEFVDHALRFFGHDAAQEIHSPNERGTHLARLVGAGKHLLILDGLEPLQHAPGPSEGRLRDATLHALLSGISAINHGLCVITTRVSVAELASGRQSVSPEVRLASLTDEAGAELLEQLGASGSQHERQAVVRKFDGHALSLKLLGTYLTKVHQGNLSKHTDVRLLKADRGKQAHRVMEAYERWLVRDNWRVELAILRLLGLFDRPADAACLQALTCPPEIKGLTEPLIDLNADEWAWAVTSLRELGLLTADSEPRTQLDCHPMIREFFESQLESRLPGAAAQAHARLSMHLQSVPRCHRPETARELMPLFQAVYHGCKARQWQDALQVLHVRIRRGPEAFYWRKLGLSGLTLWALEGFFRRPWTQPVYELDQTQRAFVVSEASFLLRALGRLREARHATRIAIELNVSIASFDRAAVMAGNLSQLLLKVGDIAEAIRAGEQGVELADRSQSAFQQTVNHAKLASSLHFAGRLPEAKSAAANAEIIHEQYEPSCPLLYQLPGFQVWMIQLAHAIDASNRVWAFPHSLDVQNVDAALTACRQVRERIETIFGWKDSPRWDASRNILLDTGLEYLALGRSLLAEGLLNAHGVRRSSSAVSTANEIFAQARRHIDTSVSFLRQVGDQDELPGGLIARAELSLAQSTAAAAMGDLDGFLSTGLADLAEAEQIAVRGEMAAWLVDVYAVCCRYQIVVKEFAVAKALLERAKALVGESARPYRSHVPEWKDWRRPIYMDALRNDEIVRYCRRDSEIELLSELLSAH